MAIAKHTEMALEFPVGGLHKGAAYQTTPPFTTPSALNVRPVDVIEGRGRGGSRPGLRKAFAESLDDLPVRMLDQVTLIQNDGYAAWDDLFDRELLGANWVVGSAGAVVQPLPVIADGQAGSTAAATKVFAVLDASTINIDASQPYSVSAYLRPFENEWHGTYSIFFRMQSAFGVVDPENYGVEVRLLLNSTTATKGGGVRSAVAGTVTAVNFDTSKILGTAQAGWLTALIEGNNLKVWWQEVLIYETAILPGTQTGTRVGFGVTCQTAKRSYVDIFRVQYYRAGSLDTTKRTILIGSAGGTIFKEDIAGSLSELATDSTLAADRYLQSAARLQQLFIADHGAPLLDESNGSIASNGVDLTSASVADWTAHDIDIEDHVCVLTNAQGAVNAGVYRIAALVTGKLTLTSTAGGTGTCNFRIERSPKIYDPANDSLTHYMADSGKGSVLTGCPMICIFNDRIVLAGAANDPHLWAMSRQGDPTDWDYGATDVQRAVAGVVSDAGLVGEPLTALIPASSDYLVFACDSSLWLLRGDPAFGGKIVNLSRAIGVVSRNAWCRTPEGMVVFLSHDGLYVLSPSAGSFPESWSRERLPRELINIDRERFETTMIYDVKDRGIHIYVMPAEQGAGGGHWWADWQTKSFWPVTLQPGHVPTALHGYVSGPMGNDTVLLGCYDGYIRRYSALVADDDGEAIESHVVLGPMRAGRGGLSDGLLVGLVGTLGEGSGDVTWTVLTGESMEAVLRSAGAASGTWSIVGEHGRQAMARPRVRAAAFALKLSGTGSWTVDSIVATRQPAGRSRL